MTKVVSVGLGAIGIAIAHALLNKSSVELIAAVDASDALAGRRMADAVPNAPANITISSDLSHVLGGEDKGVVVQATASRLEDIAPQLEAIIGHGWNVISTSEELTNARATDPAWRLTWISSPLRTASRCSAPV